MAGETIGSLGFIERIESYHIVELQVRIVSPTKQSVHVVGYEHPVNTVPRYQHHIFGTVIHGHEVVRNDIPCERRIIKEIIPVFRKELRWLALAVLNPLPEANHCGLVVRMSVGPLGVGLEAEFQFIIEIRHRGSTEQAERGRVVQELQTDTFVTLSVERRRVVESLDTLESVDNCGIRLLVVEIVFSEELGDAGTVVVVEKIYRESVYTYTDIIISLVCSLRRCEPATTAEHVVNDSDTAGVVGAGRIRKIGLQTED